MTPALLIARGLIVHWVTFVACAGRIRIRHDRVRTRAARSGPTTNPIVPNALTLASPISLWRLAQRLSRRQLSGRYLLFGISIGAGVDVLATRGLPS
jgi:hypothetical protein